MDINIELELQKMGLTQKEYEEIIQLILDKKNKLIDIDWSEIIEQYNLSISSDTLRKASSTIFGGAFIYQYLQDNVVNNKGNINNIKSTTTMNKDGTISSNRLLELNEQELKNPSYILKAHGFEPDLWKIVNVRNTIREALSKQKGAIALYASYLTVKPIEDNEIPLAKLEEFFNRLDRQYSLPKVKITNDYLSGDKLLLIDIADLHLNLLTSYLTTGNEYNCKIAEKIFFEVINNIISRTNHYNFAKVIFCIGGDMLNADNLKGTTTKGTPQDNDVSYYDAYEILTEMVIKAIDILKETYKCKLDIIYVVGNHDEVAGFKLAKFIDAWYRNDDLVFVDYSPLPRKYIVFGKTLFCFAHDAGKLSDLPALIADEARDVWSQINHTEVLLQHMHSENVLFEKSNIRIQILPTISPKSKWSNDKGYNSKRQCKTFIYDINDGLTDVLYTTIK